MVVALCEQQRGEGSGKSERGRRGETLRPHQHEEEAGHTVVALARWRARDSPTWRPCTRHTALIEAFL
jgi:hypothetical protein